jgi:hypothetical protein
MSVRAAANGSAEPILTVAEYRAKFRNSHLCGLQATFNGDPEMAWVVFSYFQQPKWYHVHFLCILRPPFHFGCRVFCGGRGLIQSGALDRAKLTVAPILLWAGPIFLGRAKLVFGGIGVGMGRGSVGTNWNLIARIVREYCQVAEIQAKVAELRGNGRRLLTL